MKRLIHTITLNSLSKFQRFMPNKCDQLDTKFDKKINQLTYRLEKRFEELDSKLEKKNNQIANRPTWFAKQIDNDFCLKTE
ncbi:MAG: hypothetical protein LBJ97_01185 [Mycoplasmataceae bacterium]|nr:hypothetical protein [Mycoplasmataceae bacterium]